MQFTMYVVILLLVAISGTGIIHGTMGTGELTKYHRIRITDHWFL